MCYKINNEINYNDIKTFSMKIICWLEMLKSFNSQLGIAQRFKFCHAVNALKLRI